MKNNLLLLAVFSLLINSLSVAQQSFKLPPFDQFKLPNGLTIYLMEQHEVPLINVAGIFPAGAVYDGEKSGLASLTAACLSSGTKKFTKKQIDEELDFIGASINIFSSKENSSLSSRFASKDQDKIFGMIQSVLTEPAFDKDEFEKEKKRKLTALERATESPRSVQQNYWDKLIYADHVYANPTAGTAAGVGKLTRDDLMAFYANHYIPEGSSIAIVGDFDKKKMKLLVTKLFSTWKSTGPRLPDPASATPVFPPAGKVLLVNKEDARETTLLIGGKGVKKNNPDAVALEVVNTVFGGRFTSMLNDALRVSSGLTYGAGSNFSSLKNGGSFYISTFTATKSTEPTIDMALDVLKKLHKDGLDEETLTSAKNYVKGQFPPRYETSGQLANWLNTMFWYKLEPSFINNFQKEVDDLTTAKAREIINKYYPENNLQFVLIGKSADIKKIAGKYGPVTETQIKGDKLRAF
ncbi:MAG: pitrilysin family protein [Chitinophagaceae bacterium]